MSRFLTFALLGLVFVSPQLQAQDDGDLEAAKLLRIFVADHKASVFAVIAALYLFGQPRHHVF